MKPYGVIKNALSLDVVDFANAYLLLKRQVLKTSFKERYINPFSEDWGTFNDAQIPNTYAIYGDVAMDTLLKGLKPLMEKRAREPLSCTYSYARIYKKGDVLVRHQDRFSCEISCTMTLGGDSWPIFIDPTGKSNVEKVISECEIITKPNPNKGVKITLKPGDLFFYHGCELEHWREVFEGEYCSQVFLHYNRANSEQGQQNVNDRRPHLGLPSWFRDK